MTDRLLDSGILIRHLRDHRGYPDMVDRLTDEGGVYISAFMRLKVVRGMREHERKDTLVLIDSLLTLPMDSTIADLAGELVRTWKSKGVILEEGDVLIVALAIHHKLDLITTNARHFPMSELTVWQVEEEGQPNLW